MTRQVIFYTGIALALVLMLIVPSLFYILAGRANLEWTLYGLVSSNLPTIAGTLIIVVLVMCRTQILGAPRKH